MVQLTKGAGFVDRLPPCSDRYFISACLQRVWRHDRHTTFGYLSCLYKREAGHFRSSFFIFVNPPKARSLLSSVPIHIRSFPGQDAFALFQGIHLAISFSDSKLRRPVIILMVKPLEIGFSVRFLAK